jgi:23S rRNA (cytosine1962-C5)-methyltransferase
MTLVGTATPGADTNHVGLVVVSARGAGRWAAGHPWIYRTDVYAEPRAEPGLVTVSDRRGRHLGQALYSPQSEIRLRLLTRGRERIDAAWWQARIGGALARRALGADTAYRVVSAEGDGLPSLIIDRYGPYVVVQLLSAGLERQRADVLAGVDGALAPAGVLLRNDAAIRRHERLPLEVSLVHGAVPETVEVTEHGLRYLAAPWSGQKTGAFLDQRDNRALVEAHAPLGGRALDLFAYHGSFALHLARRASHVVAVDSSLEALARGGENAALNGFTNITWREANAFDLLRELERQGERFEAVVLDPPAFAKTKASVARALAGYKEINLRAMRLLAPGGVLFTCSCSYHVSRATFADMLAAAAHDAGRSLRVLTWTGAATDHPEVLNVPETGYLKGALLAAAD